MSDQQPRPPVLDDAEWARLWKMADDRYDALCMDIMRSIADGGSLDDVLELVGDSMNNCNRVDYESVAAFNAAETRLKTEIVG